VCNLADQRGFIRFGLLDPAARLVGVVVGGPIQRYAEEGVAGDLPWLEGPARCLRLAGVLLPAADHTRKRGQDQRNAEPSRHVHASERSARTPADKAGGVPRPPRWLSQLSQSTSGATNQKATGQSKSARNLARRPCQRVPSRSVRRMPSKSGLSTVCIRKRWSQSRRANQRCHRAALAEPAANSSVRSRTFG